MSNAPHSDEEIPPGPPVPPPSTQVPADPDVPPEPIAEGSDAVRIAITDFEGPLDLLLYLVKKHELEILNIPIAFITDQYLAYVHRLQALNLDVAGEYLLMAATLAFLKSRELLPPDPSEQVVDLDEEDEGDPRQELIRRLLEYQKYKEAAGKLGARPVVGRNVWLRGTTAASAAGVEGENAGPAPLEEIPVFRLIEAFEKVLSKSRVKLTHDVVVDRISISDKINEIVDRLEKEGTFPFSSCFAIDDDDGGARHQVVVTFLAILEMTKLKMIRVHQPAVGGEIYLSSAGADLREQQAAVTADEEFSG